ncbi:MAG: tRNA (N6-threonylcarbamoyladenosine(37)-N6)-methyltransferase TrmO [Desulfovibrionaceae bacterium]
MDTILFRPIGVIHSPFAEREGMPIQPSGAKGAVGKICLEPDLAEGLQDLDGFSHIILLYQFHASCGYNLQVKPFMDTVARGLFATRAPRRPNPIGLSVVRLTAVEGDVLHILDVDVLDQTPLLDIKPYVPRFDAPSDGVRCGWLEENADKSEHIRSDDRFVKEDI